MKSKTIDKLIVTYLIIIATLVLSILYFDTLIGWAKHLWRIVTPFFIGFSIAYVINILMTKIEKMYFPKSKKMVVAKTRRVVSLLLSVFIILFILVAVIYVVLPQIFKTFADIGSQFPKFNARLNRLIVQNETLFPAIAKQLKELNIDWENLTQNVANYLTNGISGIFSSSIGMVTIIASSLFDLIMSIVFAMYLLLGKEKLLGQLQRVQQAFMKKDLLLKLNAYLRITHESFTNFIIGQCTEAVIIGTLCTCGMWIFRFPYAASIGVFVGATALVPIVGAYFGAGVGTFLIFMVDPMKAVWFLVYIIILQQLENNFIYPRVVGTSIGLPGVWVLVTIIIGGGLGGIVGMLIGVPIAATLYKLLQAETRERLATGIPPNSKG